MAVQQRWLCGPMMSHSVAREKTKSTTHKGKSKENKSGKSGKSKGGKGKSSGKSSVKGKGDPLKIAPCVSNPMSIVW